MTPLTRFSRQILGSAPTVEDIIRLVGSDMFKEVMTAALYLKEYDVGIEIVQNLIALMEGSPALDTLNAEHRAALVRLWRSKLRFLDRADRWDEYVSTVVDLRKRADLVESSPPQSLHESNYRHYRLMLSQHRLNAQHRAVYEELAARAKACQDRTYHSDGTWTANVPATLRHMLDDLFLAERLRIIERKILRRREGKPTTHLHHKQAWQLTAKEYEMRREWLRTWRLYCRRCKDIIHRASASS
jgi:hypothetical protein